MSFKRPPLCEELPYHADSSHYFELLNDLPWPVFLDSTQNSTQNNRYDILAADPIVTLTTTEQGTTIQEQQGDESFSDKDPFMLLQQQLQHYPQHSPTDLPFCGGAIGFFSYDLGRTIESIPNSAQNNEQIPDMAVGIYDWAIITDHQQQQCWLVSFGVNKQTREQWSDLIDRVTNPVTVQTYSFKVAGKLRCNFDRKKYQHAFSKIQRYIREGDCYQVNLAKRFEIDAEGNPWYAYKLLRQINAAPFSSFFSTPQLTLLSSSPERLLQVQDDHVETKPIKGTRRRTPNNPSQDLALANELLNSIKDRAENLMIVDLLRNDLGKVCIPGSIKVPKPFALESFATVHHLVSTITGTLADNQDAVSLLRACFPGGSITGAPKLRAMEIIEELEPNRRGGYCGSMAYIGFDGDMDSNILIRTLFYSDNRLRFWAGGGIVADSNADDEYQEIHDKAAALIKLIDQLR
ncbi:MAG: aminodeoxychorismate synthase component I [Gammaproteobacteria bacterium]|nr:MAG: aminodeoxychorismate synthase component I [Gammaproteobacteria bacterium]